MLVEKSKENKNYARNLASRVIKYILLLIVPLFFNNLYGYSQSSVLSDSSDRIVEIENIFITGNKRTKEFVILRELDVKAGQRYNIEDLKVILDTDRNKVYNTSLFNTVEIGILDVSLEKVIVQVDVRERWYFYPIPKIDFVDRNFNDWWVNHNHDLSRLEYGIKFNEYNFRGRNERISILLQAGYTDVAELKYTIPYINKNQNTGISFLFKYGENTNTAYTTIDNKREFVDSEEIIRKDFRTGLTLTKRKSFYNRHHISGYYSNRWVGDTVISLNANYFKEGDQRQQYFYLAYTYSSDHRDISAYPLNGYNFQVSAVKTGLGIYDDVNILALKTFFAKYLELKYRFFLSNYSSVSVTFPENQPYANISGIGYGRDVIRGYELFVVDGKSFFLNKTTFKKELIKTSKQLNFIPVEQFQSFPFAAYLKTYFDFGYVRSVTNLEQNNQLTDKLIWGAGFGLDIFSSYDLVTRLEYSFNSDGVSGFFFHFKKEF